MSSPCLSLTYLAKIAVCSSARQQFQLMVYIFLFGMLSSWAAAAGHYTSAFCDAAASVSPHGFEDNWWRDTMTTQAQLNEHAAARSDGMCELGQGNSLVQSHKMQFRSMVTFQESDGPSAEGVEEAPLEGLDQHSTFSLASYGGAIGLMESLSSRVTSAACRPDSTATAAIVIASLMVIACFVSVVVAQTSNAPESGKFEPTHTMDETEGWNRGHIRDANMRVSVEPSPRGVLIPRSVAKLGMHDDHRATTAAEDALGSSSEPFCPDLVVPHHFECLLIIPVQKIRSGPFDVTDTNGSVVLQVNPRESSVAFPTDWALHSSHSFGPGMSQASITSTVPHRGAAVALDKLRALTLTTTQGAVLAQCFPSNAATVPGARGNVEFHLLRANSNRTFAWLRRNESQDYFVLTTVTGLCMRFSGSFEHYAVNVLDDHAKLLATTEACHVDFDAPGKYYRLRVASFTDIGLVLCSLLCINQLVEGPVV